MSDRTALAKAAELLRENFALDTTLREMLKDLSVPAVSAPRQRSLPGIRASESDPKNPTRGEVSASRAAARRSQHRETIELFCRLWSELRGGRYQVIGGRDGKAVKTLIGFPDATPQEVERRMRIAFADPWFKQHGNLAVFCSRWSNLDRGSCGAETQHHRGSSGAGSSTAGKRVVGYNELTGELVYG